MGEVRNEAPQQVTPPEPAATGAGVGQAVPPLTRSTDSFWDRIKRHKVVEWTLAYVAFGYALLHGVQMAREAFEWPTSVSRITLLVLLLGAPIAATLAWYHGHRARHRISGVELSILIALLLVAGSVLWWASRMSSTHVASTAAADATHFNPPLGDKSIAVLPFVVPRRMCQFALANERERQQFSRTTIHVIASCGFYTRAGIRNCAG